MKSQMRGKKKDQTTVVASEHIVHKIADKYIANRQNLLPNRITAVQTCCEVYEKRVQHKIKSTNELTIK